MTRGLRISILIKRNKTLVEKRRSRPRYSSEETETKIIISNTHETGEVIVYKRLSRRSTL